MLSVLITDGRDEIMTSLLTEAEEESVNTHVVNAEETMGYEIAAKHHGLKQHNTCQKKKKKNTSGRFRKEDEDKINKD